MNVYELKLCCCLSIWCYRFIGRIGLMSGRVRACLSCAGCWAFFFAAPSREKAGCRLYEGDDPVRNDLIKYVWLGQENKTVSDQSMSQVSLRLKTTGCFLRITTLDALSDASLERLGVHLQLRLR